MRWKTCGKSPIRAGAGRTAGIAAGRAVEMRVALAACDRRDRSAGVRRRGGGRPGRSRRRPRRLSDTADVGRRLDRLSRDLARWKDAGVRIRSQRRRQSGHLGPADSGRRSRQADPTTPPTKSSRRSRPMAAGSPFSPAGSEEASMSSRRWAAKNGCSPRAAFRRGFRQTEAGSPMASRNRPAARSRWRQPLAVRPTLVAPAFTGLRRRSGHPTADICCSGRSATATRRRKTTSTGTSRRFQAGRPCAPKRAQRVLREGFQAFQGLPSPDAWARAGNRILFHGSVGDSSNMWQVAISPGSWRDQRHAAASDIRHDRRSRGLGDLRRADGVHQPNDGSRHLEPANRRRSREVRARSNASPRMPPMTTTRRCRTTGQRWCSVRGEQGGSASC